MWNNLVGGSYTYLFRVNTLVGQNPIIDTANEGIGYVSLIATLCPDSLLDSDKVVQPWELYFDAKEGYAIK